MHECGSRENVKKIKGQNFQDMQDGVQNYQKIQDPNKSYHEFVDEKFGKQRFEEFQDMGFKKQKFQDQPAQLFASLYRKIAARAWPKCELYGIETKLHLRKLLR